MSRIEHRLKRPNDMSEIEKRRFKEHRPTAFDDYLECLNEMGQEHRSRFQRLLQFVHENLTQPEDKAKIVMEYTGQPPGCKCPVLAFGEIPKQLMKTGTWIARITLKGEPRIILPDIWLRLDSESFVDRGVTSKSNLRTEGCFSPKNTDDFLAHPTSFLTHTKLRRKK